MSAGPENTSVIVRIMRLGIRAIILFAANFAFMFIVSRILPDQKGNGFADLGPVLLPILFSIVTGIFYVAVGLATSKGEKKMFWVVMVANLLFSGVVMALRLGA